ncbi:hypothetical protein BsWGS_09232 [Bradybaena similaris]
MLDATPDLKLAVSFRLDRCRTMAKYSFILLGIFVLMPTQGDSFDTCCRCNDCDSYWIVCGSRCCRTGEGGCTCYNCNFQNSQVDSLDSVNGSTSVTQPASNDTNACYYRSRVRLGEHPKKP